MPEVLVQGTRLPEIAVEVSADRVQLYGEVTGDFNPIHFDDDAAATVGFPGRIAHGMISGALLSRLLTRYFGERWLTAGSLSIRFVRPVAVGERVVAKGVVREVSPLSLDVWVEGEDGQRVIVGEARLGGTGSTETRAL